MTLTRTAPSRRSATLAPIAVTCVARDLPPVDTFAAYRRLVAARGAADVFLLESLAGPLRDTAQAIVGFGHLLSLEVSGCHVRLSGRPFLVDRMARGLRAAGVVEDDGHRLRLPHAFGLFDLLRAAQAQFAVDGVAPTPGGYRFGFFGMLGYDIVHAIERLPRTIAPRQGRADVHLALFRSALVTDVASGRCRLIEARSTAWSPDGTAFEPPAPASAPATPPTPPAAPRPLAVADTMTREDFCRKVDTALAHIGIGDIYQVQVGHEIAIRSSIAPLDVYRRLRARNPAPYMYLTTLGGQTLIGASPEVLFRLEGRRIVMRPLAGTAPRRGDADVDAAAVAALRTDEKEIAEHVMLVDLCRNDMGRVCVPGTLAVTDLMSVERYSHVFHLVSNVEADAAPGVDAWELIRATFPAGTMTGAPKVRAMEIIEDLEVSRRGAYAGAVGFVDFSGEAVLALCIRTAVHEGAAYAIRASAGVVADSQSDKEWRETVAKMGATYWAITGEELVP
jgi:anthranilate synthase component I